MLLLSLSVVVLFFSMQSLFPLNIVVVFLNIVPSLWRNYNYSLTSLCSFCSLMILLLDVALVLPQHCSCSFSTVFLIDITLRFCSYSLLSFLFNVAPTPQCHSYSYSLSFLLFLDATPTLHISSTFCSPSMLLLFLLLMLLLLLLFQIGTSLFHIFASVGGKNFPNSTFLGQVWRWICFFLQMFVCWWLDPCFDYPCFFR